MWATTRHPVRPLVPDGLGAAAGRGVVVDVVDVIVVDDRVVGHFRCSGTHEGEFLGLPPTGEQVTVRGVDIVTVVDGKCTEHWGWDDSWQLMVPAGPPPA